jgi:hypothetical protein
LGAYRHDLPIPPHAKANRIAGKRFLRVRRQLVECRDAMGLSDRKRAA